MTATIRQLSPMPRLALQAGTGADARALMGAYLPGVEFAESVAEADLVLVWWDGSRVAIDRERAGRPIVALCAGGADALAAALDAGADVALALPVTEALLRAVAGAHARSGRARAQEPTPPPAAEPSGIALDRRARTLSVRGVPVPLTLREFDLLAYLVENPGAACSRDELLARVWGIDFETGTNTVDVFVYSLRQKLRAQGLGGAIQTVRGVGYRLTPNLP